MQGQVEWWLALLKHLSCKEFGEWMRRSGRLFLMKLTSADESEFVLRNLKIKWKIKLRY